MILSKPNRNDTVVIKLQSGEELMARYVEQDTTGTTVCSPRVLTPTQQGVALVPWMMSAPDAKNVIINKDHITSMLTASAEICNMYTEAVTGIAMPK